MAPYRNGSRRSSIRATRLTYARPRYQRISGVLIDTESVQTNGDVTALSLQAPAEALLAATITNAYANILGQIDVSVTPTAAAPTFTRVVYGVGIAWARRDLITSGADAATFPNPLADSDSWVWRRLRAITFAATATTGGSNGDAYNGTVSVYARTRRPQPSAAHQLYLFMALDTATAVNLGSLNLTSVLRASFALP